MNELKYSKEKEKEFLRLYNRLVKKHRILLYTQALNIKASEGSNIESVWALNKKSFAFKASESFLDKWYIPSIRKEITFLFKEIQKINGGKTQGENKKLLSVILSRAIRSCRATTHSDLATLKQPQVTSYYCFKHKKICKPLFSMRFMV